MKMLSLSVVKTKLGEIVDDIERRDEVVTVTRKGKPVAVIVSKDEYDGWHETIAILSDHEFRKEIRAGIQALKRTKRRYTIDELFAE
jgi:prevent-host-death family protein